MMESILPTENTDSETNVADEMEVDPSFVPDEFIEPDDTALVEPVVPVEFAASTSVTEIENSLSSLDAVYDVPVTIQAILGRAKMSVADVVRLKVGHVIELDRRVGEPVDILVNGRLIARGEVVLIDGLLGVTLTEIVRRDEE
ncbi:flagellar motor switch protein FliN [Sphingorhabdus sp. M41]|uniref:flagellar motor switch protein FliN n=1 Tax=Sphingorhabdus sp. M41 TaxID=1806885 RepID=UPI000AE87266|nr:flagellar motor switch protein FliN [Sphingorhabdus sp. M41]